MLNIRADAWHLHVFTQAYINDRHWLDVECLLPEAAGQKIPEVEEFEAYSAEVQRMTPEQFDKEAQKRHTDLAKAAETARREWWKRQEALYTAKKAADIRQRLYEGRMSLCPYFWSVVWATIFYYGVVRSTRPIRQFFGSIAPALGYGFLGLLAASLIGFIGYGIYESRDQIPTPTSIATDYKNWRQERRQAAIEEQQQAQAEALRKQELAEWERQHPDEALARKQEAEFNRQEQARYEARQKAQEWENDKRDLANFALQIGVFVGAIVGIALACVLLYYFGKLVGKFFRLLGRLLTPVVRPLSFKNVPEHGFRAWLLRQFRRIARAWAAWRRFWHDTKELVAAFAKAKKERVCPYLRITNGNQNHSQA